MLRSCTNITFLHILALLIPQGGSPSYNSRRSVVLPRLQYLRIGGYNANRVLVLPYLNVPPTAEIAFGENGVDLEPLRSFLTENTPLIRWLSIVLPPGYKWEDLDGIEFCLRVIGENLERLGIFSSSESAINLPPINFPSTPRDRTVFTLPNLMVLTIKCEYRTGILYHPPLLDKLRAPKLTHLLAEASGPCLSDVTLFLCRSQCPLLFLHVSLHTSEAHWLEALLSVTPLTRWCQVDIRQVVPLLGKLTLRDPSGEYQFWKHLQFFRILIDQEEADINIPREIALFINSRPAVKFMEGYAFCDLIGHPNMWL
ncbi:hypothetical protein VNI00_012572 [Paramarasmius palmivorus]|uniref:Uncharacterized protein n=1 Tax=Paramarasmius palmivorus TaxID=297713 RepID=A0AAW0C5U9_9AGAR